MRILFAILLLNLAACGGTQEGNADLKAKEVDGEVKGEAKVDVTAKQPKCEDIDGLKVTYNDVVPDDYTGVAFVCEDGKVEVLTNFKEGKAVGIQRNWHENGQLRLEINWKDGKKDGVERFWLESGQLYTEINYKDGERDGVERIWYENGQLKVEINYKDGKEEGFLRVWHENGQLKWEYQQKDGEIIDGPIYYYDEYGSTIKIEYYEDGEKVRCDGDC